ncbi:MAG: hypothetical protein CL908_25030 [Deltaproteobacteria bacterium]|nr:hypothetical protein [Deltaproteobacteria bacterium]
MSFRRGDRIRVKNPQSEYTGCRGTIADPASEERAGVSVLGHHVAIDGENGVVRPFLVDDLEPLRVARVPGRASAPVRQEADGGPSSE